MSFWDRVKKFFIGSDRDVPELPPTRDVAKPPRFQRPERPTQGVSRDVQVSNPSWRSVQDYMDSNLTNRGVARFDEQQPQLAALFNVVADPHQSENIKRDAYEELEDMLADYGFVFRGGVSSISDFDWGEFKNNYPVLDI